MEMDEDTMIQMEIGKLSERQTEKERDERDRETERQKERAGELGGGSSGGGGGGSTAHLFIALHKVTRQRANYSPTHHTPHPLHRT